VVTEYLAASGLQDALDRLGFNLVGYGCTTCIGNSGPLPEPIEKAIVTGDLTVSSVLSGNRNFEGRVHPLVKANWLASPPLVVAYALAGNVRLDISKDPIAEDAEGRPVYLADLWPTQAEVAEAVARVSTAMFTDEYASVFDGDATWQAISVPDSKTYHWSDSSTYIQHPPYFQGMAPEPAPLADVDGARILALLGDSVTTDHISPAGSFSADSPAGRYLVERGIHKPDFNSYGSRRGNHEVMMRGTFANVRISNEMLDGVEGGYTRHVPSGEQLPIYDAAMRYAEEGTPLIVVAGREYGTGSSRDWAAKGTLLLGVRAVYRGVLRAYPPLQPHRHGRAAAAVRGRRKPQDPRPHRRRDPVAARHCRRCLTGAGGHARGHLPGREHPQLRTQGAHRYRQRGQLLRRRRHPALRAAAAHGRMITAA
jgi:aconitate hydratase